MRRIIITLLFVSIILINIPLFKSKKEVIIHTKKQEIPKLILKKPLQFPLNHPRVNMYRSEQSSYDFI